MAKLHSFLTFGVLALLFSLGISNNAIADKITVSVETEPSDVDARLYRLDDEWNAASLDTCSTPCILKMKAKKFKPEKYKYYVTFSKKNFVSDRDEPLDPDQLETGSVTLFKSLKSMAQVKAERKLEYQEIRRDARDKLQDNIQSCREQASNPNSPDRDLAPCWRHVLATVPERLFSLKESGVCMAVFDVNSTGETENVQVKCSHPVLSSPAIKSVKSWLYLPKRISGNNVKSLAVEARVSFGVTDPNGNLYPTKEIPEN